MVIQLHLKNSLLTNDLKYVIIPPFEFDMVYACNRGGRFYQPPIMVDYRYFPRSAIFFCQNVRGFKKEKEKRNETE